MGKNKILYKRNEIGGVNRNDKYGISLELLTNGFKNKINEIKSITKNVSNTVKQNFTDMKNEFSTGFNLDTEKAEQDVNDLSQKLNQAQKELNKLNSARRPDTDAIARMTSSVRNLELSLEAAKADLDMLNNSNMANLGSKMKSLGNNIKKAFSFSNLKNEFNSFGSKATKVFSNVLKGSNNSGNALSKMAKKTTTSFKHMLFALVGVEAGLAGLRKAVQSYLSYDQQLSTQLENTWAGLGSVLAPVIQNIINLFSTAVAYVNAFIKALFGIDSVANANAKALASQNKQAKTLTNMDEITNINKNSDSGSGQGAIELPKVSMSDFMNQLVEQIKSGDWYGVGQTIAEKLNETLESIDWASIQSKASSIGTNIASFLNGGIENIDWKLVGGTLAEGINTVIDFAYSFVTTFNWSAFGKAISDSINGFFEKMDWKRAGETLSKGIRGIFTSVKAFIAELNWYQIGQDIWDFLISIDWEGIIEDLAEIIGEAIAGIGLLLAGFIEDAVIGIGDYFGEKIEECGGDIVGGLLKGIVDAIDGIAEWLYEHLAKPFIDGVKKVFGIHSPSTVMAEIGTYLIEGLKQGLQNLWENVKQIFENLKTNISNKFSEIWANIKNTFSNVAEWFKNIFSDAWNGVKNVVTSVWDDILSLFSKGGEIFNGVVDGIANVFKTIVNALISGINRVIKVPFDTINGILNFIRNIEVLGVAPFKGLWKKNPLPVPQIPKLNVGTNYVPEDQVAMIHKGEAVIPRKFNSAEYFSNINNNDETNALLIEVNRNLLELIDKDTNLYVDGKNMSKALYKPLKNEEQRLGSSSTVVVR